jgi:hypothetical protein
MKKIVMLVVLALFAASLCFADVDTVSKKVYSYGIKNDTGSRQITEIPVTSIRPTVDKVIGYDIYPTSNETAEGYIGIFDGTNKSLSGEVFAENEALSDKGLSKLWNFGKYIFEGVVVSQGAKTQAQIYFVKE